MAQGVEADVVVVWTLVVPVVPVLGHGVVADATVVPELVTVEETPVDVDVEVVVPAFVVEALEVVELVLGHGVVVVDVDAVEVAVPEVDLAEVADVPVDNAPLTPVVPLTPTVSLTRVVPLTPTDPVTPAPADTVPDAVLSQSTVVVELLRAPLSRLEMRPNVCPRK